MNKLFFVLLFAFTCVRISAQVNAVPVCHVSGNPNGIAGMQVMDGARQCQTAYDTLNHVFYNFVEVNAPGSKWVVVGGGSGKCLAETVVQASGGFTIGDPVLFDDGVLIDASSNSLLPAQAVITAIPDANTIIISYGGSCEATAHGYTIDSSYYTGRVSGVLIDASKPDSTQFLFKPLDANTLTVAIANMYIGGVVVGGGGSGDVVDSTFVQNDSTFIALGDGRDLFSGLADAPRPNNGRIWYVSKSNPSCSASAVVGDPTRPFCNPWQAIDSIVTGDIVYIQPAVYTIGSIGTGADLEITAQGGNFWKAAADSITWYYSAGAIIRSIDTLTACRLFSFNTASSNVFIKVAGNGQFDLCGQFFGTNNTSAVIKINCDFEGDVLSAGFNTAQHNSDFFRVRFKRFVLRYPTSIGGAGAPGFIFGFLSSTANQSKNSEYNINIENADAGSRYFPNGWNANNSLIQIGRLYKSTLNVNVDNFYISRKGARALLSSPGFASDSSIVNINVGNLFAVDHLLGSTYSQYQITESTRNVDPNNQLQAYTSPLGLGSLVGIDIPFGTADYNTINVKIGNCYSDLTLCGHVNTGYHINFDIDNFIARSNNPAIMSGERGASNNTGTVTYNIKNAIGKGSLILEAQKRPEIRYISGNYRTLSSGLPVVTYNNENLTTNKTTFKNATLIGNSGKAIAPITATNAREYFIQNVFSNSITIDTDVTELVQPIFRNSNVK